MPSSGVCKDRLLIYIKIRKNIFKTERKKERKKEGKKEEMENNPAGLGGAESHPIPWM